jgi:tetratricopeptide (TPR) repeat protein
VGVIFLCCLGALVTRNRVLIPLIKSLRAANSAPTMLPTSLPENIGNVLSTPVPAGGDQLPAEVVAAQERAHSNPNDLGAQFDLALVYWTSDMPDEAYLTLHRIIQLAGPENAPFYTQAGDKFLALQAWPPAAIMYLQAVKSHAAKGNIPPDLLTHFHEAVYKSADRSDALRVLAAEEIAKVDQPISFILRSRSALYAKDFNLAYLHLDKVKKLAPGMHEASLLEAELDSFDGKPEQARKLLRSLTSDKTTPDWIRIFADEIMKRLP